MTEIASPTPGDDPIQTRATSPRRADGAAPIASPSLQDPHHASGPVSVLVVDDSPLIQERLSELLETTPGARLVAQAESGDQALTLFHRHQPDAVVLDIQLPDRSGLELLAQFKRERPACVVMMLTTFAFEELRARCTTLGADFFFDKSTEFERVTEVLQTMQTQHP